MNTEQDGKKRKVKVNNDKRCEVKEKVIKWRN